MVGSVRGGRGFDPDPGQTKDLMIGATVVSTHHLEEKTKTVRPRV